MSKELTKYHISIRIMHWLMAVLILTMIGVGWYMADLPKDNPLKNNLVNLHKSIGALLLILFVIRVLLRFTRNHPPLPASMKFIEQKLAHAGHFALYAFMLVAPLSGYAMSNMYGYGVNMFGLEMPRLFPVNKELAGIAHEAHEVLPYILLGIIILHIAAVIKHKFFDKPENDVLNRML